MCSWFPAITPLLPVLPLHCLLSLMHRKVSDGVRSPPGPCLPSDETEGNSKFDSSLCFCKTGRRGAHFFPHQLRCAEKGGKPKIRREETFSPTSASSCHGPDLPQALSICFHLLMASPPTALPWQVPRAALPLCCSSPEAQACRTLTVLPLPPGGPSQKQDAQKEQMKAEKKPDTTPKNAQGGGRGGVLSSSVLPMFKQGTPLGSCLISLGVRGIYSFVFFFKQKGLPTTTARREPTPLDKQTCLKSTHGNPVSLAPGEEKCLDCS